MSFLDSAARPVRETLEQAVAHFNEAIKLTVHTGASIGGRTFAGGSSAWGRVRRWSGRRGCVDSRAAGFVPPVPWIRPQDLIRRVDPISARWPWKRHRKSATRIRVAAVRVHQFGECLIAAGFNHGACDYEYYLSRTQHDLSGTWIQPRYGHSSRSRAASKKQPN